MALRKRYRTIWLSDVHLGSRACRIDLVLEFLDSVECETLYLVGDIVDVESMRRRFFWPESHSDALVRILAFAELIQVDGLLYCNDGERVESCTALLATGPGAAPLSVAIGVAQSAGSAPVFVEMTAQQTCGFVDEPVAGTLRRFILDIYYLG